MKYVMKGFPQAQREGLEPPYGESFWEDIEDDYDFDYTWGVWQVHDDGSSTFINSDGGEPEDQTLYRNYAWVVPALNEAYQLGYLRCLNP